MHVYNSCATSTALLLCTIYFWLRVLQPLSIVPSYRSVWLCRSHTMIGPLWLRLQLCNRFVLIQIRRWLSVCKSWRSVLYCCSRIHQFTSFRAAVCAQAQALCKRVSPKIRISEQLWYSLWVKWLIIKRTLCRCHRRWHAYTPLLHISTIGNEYLLLRFGFVFRKTTSQRWESRIERQWKSNSNVCRRSFSFRSNLLSSFSIACALLILCSFFAYFSAWRCLIIVMNAVWHNNCNVDQVHRTFAASTFNCFVETRVVYRTI